MYHFNVFFIYSILGFLLETIFSLINNFNFQSGILYGFWTPVYGFGALIITFVHKMLFKDKTNHKILRFILMFLIVSLTLSLIEYLAGILIEYFFHTVFWDYSHHKFNFGKYISLEMTLLWGVLSILFLYLVKPWMDPLIKKYHTF